MDKEVIFGHSPDSDDAFMYYGIASGNVKLDNYKISHLMEDIESLNIRSEKGELDVILKETEKEENMLLSKSEDYKKLIEERLLFAYGKIRSNVKNGLAIVPIERGAAGGLSLIHI